MFPLPNIEANLVANSLSIGVVLKIKYGITTIFLGQGRDEFIISARSSFFFHFNSSIVLSNFVNDVLELSV